LKFKIHLDVTYILTVDKLPNKAPTKPGSETPIEAKMIAANKAASAHRGLIYLLRKALFIPKLNIITIVNKLSSEYTHSQPLGVSCFDVGGELQADGIHCVGPII